MIPDNFGAIPVPYSEYSNARVVILPVPYEGTVTWGKGASKGPRAIIEASKNMELWDEETGNVFEIGIHTLPEIDVHENPEDVIESVYDKVKMLLKDKKFPIILGGEHSITLGAVRAFKERFPDLSVLQFDAHADLRDEYDFTKYSHACVMRRISELNLPMVQVGIRSMSEEEKEIIESRKNRIFFAKDIHDNDNWIEDAISKLTDNVYITIDVDAFDPSIMPSTGTPEPGGLGWYRMLKVLKAVAQARRIVGFDVVELAPIPGLHAPDFMCARLVYKLIGYAQTGVAG